VAAGLVWGAVSPAGAARLPEAWQHWRIFRPVRLPAAAGPQMVLVKIPASVYGPAQPGLGDLRVLDDAGAEIPYALRARTGRHSLDWRRASLSDVGFVRGAHTEAIIDLEAGGAPHNLLAVETDRQDFFARAEVATSDDRATWRVLRESAPLFRFPGGRPEANLKVDYPESRARWLRLRIAIPDEAFPVGAVRVAWEVSEDRELEPLGGRRSPAEEAAPGETAWDVDLGWDDVPAAAVRFETAASEFHRRVRVLVRGADGEWREAGSGEIHRRRAPADPDSPEAADRERLQASFPEAAGRHFRIVVEDRDDPPVEGLAPALLGTPRTVVFRADPGRSFRLAYGNHRSPAPEYDFVRVTPPGDLAAALPAELGPEEINDAWVSPDPWTERHPVILWSALGLALAVLGFLAWRSLR
jgi:hypothetical protein